MPKVTWNRWWIYAARWQMSTPILALVLIWLAGTFSSNATADFIIVTIIANFIGSSIFFWIDRWIFRQKYARPLWEIRGGVCRGCGEICDRLYRLVKAPNYDRLDDKEPVFLCDTCSSKKTKELRERGVAI